MQNLPSHVEAAILPALVKGKEVWEARCASLVPELLGRAGDEAARRFAPKATKNLRAAKVTFVVSFDKVNPKAVQWAKKYSAELVTNVTAETRKAIRVILQRALLEGIPPKNAALLIEKVIGLDTRSAEAVMNLRERILNAKPGERIFAGKTGFKVPKKGIEEFAAKKVAKYSDKLLRQRAINIARTEVVRISNAGQELLWEQAAKKGLLDPSLDERAWTVSFDDRLCPICLDYEDDRAPIGGVFEKSGLPGPPAHPSCRCSQIIVNKR